MLGVSAILLRFSVFFVYHLLSVGLVKWKPEGSVILETVTCATPPSVEMY